MEYKTQRRIELVCIVALLFMMLPSADYLTKRALALSVTTYDNNGDEANDIVRCGNTLITTDLTTADIHFYNALSPSTQLGEITSGGGAFIGCNSTNDRAFTYTTGGTLQEIDIANRALLRSLATGCDSSHQFVDGGLLFVCGTSTGTDQVKIINLASMSITYTSTTLDDGGANECDNIIGLWYYSTTDTLFATCLTVDRITASVGFTASGSPDASTTFTSATLFGFAFDHIDSRVFACDTGALSGIFDWSGSAFSAGPTFAIGGCTNLATVDFDASTGWFTVMDGSGNFRFYDAQAGTQIFSVALGNVGASYGYGFFTSTYIPIGLATSTDFAVMDATGIDFGSGATGGEDLGDDEDIDGDGIPNNEDDDIDGDGIPNSQDSDIDGDGIPNSQDSQPCGTTGCNVNGVCIYGTALQCSGSGANAWSGFTSGQNATDMMASITDGLGFTNCGENPDHETCGSGLFLFIIILLLVEFGVLAGYLGLTTKLHADKQVVDVALILLIAGFAVVALGFYLNWIPDLVFYSIIVIIAGFLVFGLIQRIKGG